MSWSVLKRSFSKFNETSISPIRPRTKRNVKKRKQNENKLNITDDSDGENYSENSFTKRTKLNITQTRPHNISLNTQKYISDDEGEIFVDPDSDDCCVGCIAQRPSLQPLPLFNSKENSPRKLPPVQSKCANNNSSEKRWKPLKGSFNDNENSEDDIVIHEVNSDPEDPKISDTEASQGISSEVIIESSSECVLSSNLATPQIEEPSSSDPGSGKSKEISSSAESGVRNFEYNFIALEAQKEINKTLRIHPRKGGLLEKLRKVLQKHESDYAFWQHERKIGLAEQGIEVDVKEKEMCFGRCIITMEASEDAEFKIIIDPKAKINKFLALGSKAEICINNCSSYKVDGSIVYFTANKIIKK